MKTIYYRICMVILGIIFAGSVLGITNKITSLQDNITISSGDSIEKDWYQGVQDFANETCASGQYAYGFDEGTIQCRNK